MTGLERNHWLKANITMAGDIDGVVTTKTISVVNRPQIGDSADDTFPILERVGRLGTASDREIVIPQAGSIEILDSIGSFGFERKFSDLLERYSIQDQVIEIFYATTELGDYAPSYTTIFKGKSRGWRISSDQDEPRITIDFDSRVVSKKFICKKLSISEYPNLPSRNSFKTVPVVFGRDVEVRPLQVSVDTDDAATYAYATTLYSSDSDKLHRVAGIQNYYVRDHNNEYQEVLGASNVNTAVFSNSTALSSNPNVSNWEYAVQFKKASETSRNYVISQVAVEFDGLSAAAVYDGTITARIYEGVGELDTRPGRLIATSQIEASQFDASFTGGTDFFIRFPFDRPVVLGPTKAYWLSIRHEADTGPSTICVTSGLESSPPNYTWYKENNEWTIGANFIAARFNAYGLALTQDTLGQATTSGLTAATVEMTQNQNLPYSGFALPDVTRLDWIFLIDGLRDNIDAEITGTSSQVITYAHHAAKLMEREYNGTEWAATGNWDFNAYSDSHDLYDDANFTYFRELGGSTTGNPTFEDWLRDVCRNQGARVALQSNGKLGVYIWGGELTTQKVLTQENSKVLGVVGLDSSYILNNITMAYDKTFKGVSTETLIQEGQRGDYEGFLFWDVDANAIAEDLIANSQSLYGRRVLQDQLFDWVNADISAESVARFLLIHHASPPVYVDLSGPVNDFSSLEMFEVVEVKQPALPTFFGSSPNTKLPHYDGDPADPLNGFNLTRAKRYRASIEGRHIEFDNDAIPTQILTLRLLLNDKDPT